MGIKRWASRLIGMPDRWTAIQFDLAVMTFGRHIDAKLMEHDDKGRHLHSIYKLLDLPEFVSDEERKKNNREAFEALMGRGLVITAQVVN